jgi:hypothetical protein
MPSFWKRVLLLPFSPQLWSDARAWSVGAVVGPIFVLATLLSTALGLYRGYDFRQELTALARDYDARFDPLVLENGEVRVEGSRLPRSEENDTLMLVDPEETVPTPSSGQYIIVRKDSVIRSDGASIKLKQVQDFLGPQPLRLDGAALLGWVARWGSRLQAGLLAFLLAFEWIGALVALGYGLIAGAVLASIWGKSHGLSDRECSRVGLATMAVKPVAGTILALLGTSVNPCLGLFVWPAVGVGLGSWALSRLPASTPPSP